MRPLGIAVLGAGRIGRLHAATLRSVPGVRLRAVADPVASLAEWESDPDVVTARRAEEVSGLPDVDAVVVCAPTPEHLGLIEAAAAAGLHVFCEKPIDSDPARAGRAIEAARRAGVKLQVGFNRRFDPNFARLRRGVLDGEIGEPHVFRIVSRDPAPPSLDYVRSSGGIFLDMMIHDFDMVRYLSGSEIDDVHVLAAVRVDEAIGEAGDFDTAVTTLRLSSGALAVIENCRRAGYGYDQRVEIAGSRGGIEAANETATRVRLRSAAGVRTDPPLHFFLERYAGAFRAELEAFAAAIRDDGDPPVDGTDGLAAVLVARAAERSARSGAVEEVEPLGDFGVAPR